VNPAAVVVDIYPDVEEAGSEVGNDKLKVELPASY